MSELKKHLRKKYVFNQNMLIILVVASYASCVFPLIEKNNSVCLFIEMITGFVQVLENLESHGILFFGFPGLESHGMLCRVMENHGKRNHYKKL